MRSIPLQQHLPDASSIAYGCMGLGGGWDQSPVTDADVKLAHQAIDAALDAGINFFDHADIYTKGKAEQVFGEVLKQRPELRQDIYLQSKCAIRFEDESGPGRYDHSSSWLQQSVDGILSRLAVEQLDVLLLHRPDPLMAVEEVAELFSKLKAAGKVRFFGVSNMHRYQMELLNSYLEQPIVVNQLEMSLGRHDFVEQGVTVAMSESADVGFSPGTLEYCQLNKVQVQSWGSLFNGYYSGRNTNGHADADNINHTATLVSEIAARYQVSTEAVVLGWLMKLPYGVQPVIGTTDSKRIGNCAQAQKLAEQLTREDWYRLYVSARGKRMP